MERELWKVIDTRLKVVARRFDQKYVHLRPWRTAAVLPWAARHDRPVSWACDKRNWATARLRPGRVPSEATMSRRARRTGFHLLLNALAAELRGSGPPAWELMIDGKPLPVGHWSKDRDARGTPLGRGYKLHAIRGSRCLPEAWEVTAAREYEGAGVLLAGGNYEASDRYGAAAASGSQLLARPGARDTGEGHRDPSPHRLVSRRWFADGPGCGLDRERNAIERA